MRRCLWAIVGLGLISCAPSPKTAFSPPTESLAWQWVKAVENQDFDAMASLLHPQAIYEDPTARHFGDPIVLQGVDDIVDFWQRSSEVSGAENIRYEILGGFETGGVTVLNMKLSLWVSGDFWQVARDRILIEGAQSTVITVEAGKVIRVVDHVDYAFGDRLIEGYRREFGSPVPKAATESS